MKLIAFVVVLLASTAYAQDRAELVSEVERWVQRARDGDASASDRREALERAVRERGVLLATLPGDAHRPIWMLDQSADMLLLLTLKMHDTRLIVGLLGEDELEATVQSAAQAYALAQSAGELIERRFDEQRDILDAGGQLAEGDRTLNRRLAETELSVRRPLLMGRATALRLAGEGGEAASSRAAEVIDLLDGLRLSSGEPKALRDLSLALGLLHRGERDRAAELLQALASAGDVSPAMRAEAALLDAMSAAGTPDRASGVTRAASREPFVDEQGLNDAALAILATEALARVLHEAGRTEEAAQAVIEIADRRDLGGTPQQLESLVDSRLAVLASLEGDWYAVSPAVVLRAVEAMIGEDRPAFDDRAARMLEMLLRRFRQERLQAEAEERAYEPPVEHVPAVELLARLKLVQADRLEPGRRAQDPRAKALALVVSLLDSGQASLEGLLAPAATLALNDAGRTLENADRQRLLEAALGRYPADARAGRWRLGLAALLMQRGEDQLAPALALATEAMDSGDPATRADAIALAGAIHTVLASQPSSGVEALRPALAFTRANPGATALDQRALALRLAELLVARQQSAASREALAALGDDAAKPAVILRGRALVQLGRSAEAVAELRRASELVSLEADGPTYWLVWTELLELVEQGRRRRLTVEGEASAEPLARSLRAYLIKLRGEDEQLGGPPYAGRLRAIEAALER